MNNKSYRRLLPFFLFSFILVAASCMDGDYDEVDFSQAPYGNNALAETNVVSIGQLRKDGSVRMNWPAVPGSTGRLKLSVNKYVSNRDGKERTNNRVEHFLPPAAGQTAPANQQMAPGQQAANQQPGTYQPPAYQPPAPAPQWQRQQAQQAAAQQTAMPGFQRQGRMGDYQAEKF